jgi:hypothetical protein
MKKSPFSQILDGVEVTYSILSKKQSTFIMTNDRFLFLKGIETISYAREFPPKTVLPLKSMSEVPAFKSTFPIS